LDKVTVDDLCREADQKSAVDMPNTTDFTI
jgi:hypothetical protein